MAMYHWCAEEILGWSRAQVYLHNDEEVSENHLNQLETVVERLKKHEPIQYVFSKAMFRSLELFVDANVLIPRPETEELVELVLVEQQDRQLSVLDIGTGSGCIALALKKERPSWKVSACDVSREAMKVALRNAKENELEISVFHCDITDSELAWPQKLWDVVVSNPPYIRHEARNDIEQNVKGHEPHLALFAPANNPYYFFRKITEHALQLNARFVYFETEALAISELKMQLSALWPGSIRTASDLAGKPRFLVLAPSQAS